MKIIKNTVIAITICMFFVSFYIFSRVTVDDSFISWRYGKNLIDFGVWNYNPTKLDLTQAYTNPIYAMLSIIPNYFGFDTVLFFKVFSLITLVGFLIWISRISREFIYLPLILLALPATIVHIFGGLETFLFVIITAFLLIYLFENKIVNVVLCSIILFLVRPEAWSLIALVPLYFLLDEPKVSIGEIISHPFLYFKKIKLNIVRALMVFIILLFSLIIYFSVHEEYFNSVLPNAFYVKSRVPLSILKLFAFSFFILPMASLLFIGRIKLFLFSISFFGAMVLSYSTSNLHMNYSGRFAFHIFAPIYVFLFYFISRPNVDKFISFEIISYKFKNINYKLFISTGLLISISVFAMISGNLNLHMATYYPRAIYSHAELGKLIQNISDKYEIRGFSLGDAGMAAYHSRINSLDNIGLGSSYIARFGVDDNILAQYNLDLIVFHSRPDSIRFSDYNQKKIYDWSQKSNFSEICDIYWQKDYTLRVYSTKSIPEILEICSKSKILNSRSNMEMLSDNIFSPPWKYWRE